MFNLKKVSLILFTFIFTFTANAQVKKERFLDKFYIKAGYEFAGFSNSNSEYSGGAGSIIGSIVYNYNEYLQFELMYKSGNGYNYQTKSIYENNYNYQNWTGTSYHESEVEILYPSSVYLKTNYFFNKDRRTNPLYLTGSFIFDLQKRKVLNEVNRNIMLGQNYIINSYERRYVTDYYRFLAGVSGGGGLYLDLGRINFQAELAWSAKIAPFVDRSYKEFEFNFGLMTVIKL